MAEGTYLGLDLGTSGLRGLLIDRQGDAIAEASCAYATASPHDGWSEQDPDDWIVACETVFAELAKAAPEGFAAIAGIGVSGHMHGAVTLDADLKTIRPCIMWNDTRSHREAAELDSDPAFRGISANIVFPGFTAPKLKWMANNEPENFSRVAHVMLPKDYLVWWLTGRFMSEMSDASGTSWLDVANRCWSDELIAASGMKQDQFPELVEGSEAAGKVRSELASRFGWTKPPVVAGGGADNACAACGIGALKEGQGFVSLGTSGVVLVARDTFAPKADSAVHTFCHAVPGRWYQMGVSLAATDNLNWLAGILGQTPDQLTEGLPASPSGPSRVRFFPYLSGERTPHNDPDIRGAFTGLSKLADRNVLVSAVMEGVSFAMRDCLESLRATGAEPASLMAVGGGSRSDFWLATLANTLNLPIEVPEKGDFGAALGAARLAIAAAGGGDAASIMTRPGIARTIEPDSKCVQAYEAAYQKFADSYRGLRELQ